MLLRAAQALLPLVLGLLVLPHHQQVDGAALDLAALVRQYEDQVGAQLSLFGATKVGIWRILTMFVEWHI